MFSIQNFGGVRTWMEGHPRKGNISPLRMESEKVWGCLTGQGEADQINLLQLEVHSSIVNNGILSTSRSFIKGRDLARTVNLGVRKGWAMLDLYKAKLTK